MCAFLNNRESIMIPWKAPSWVPRNLKVPVSRAKFAVAPTPIQKWPLQMARKDGSKIELFVKRDDLTGAALTGNKIRKLEFLLADAIEKQCDSIIAWVCEFAYEKPMDINIS